jgi:hypothetical protein
VAKNASIPGPLVGFGRDAFLLYFGKQSVKWAYFPQELKRRIFRVFPVLKGIEGRGKNPVKGLFALRVLTPYSWCLQRRIDEGEKRFIPPSQ